MKNESLPPSMVSCPSPSLVLQRTNKTKKGKINTKRNKFGFHEMKMKWNEHSRMTGLILAGSIARIIGILVGAGPAFASITKKEEKKQKKSPISN